MLDNVHGNAQDTGMETTSTTKCSKCNHGRDAHKPSTKPGAVGWLGCSERVYQRDWNGEVNGFGTCSCRKFRP